MKDRKSGRCVILCAGETHPRALERAKICPDDFIIAADGGYLHARRFGFTPHLIVGDFDSAPPPQAEGEIETFPAEKDDTDCMLAVREGIRRGCREFIILGGTGGRLDHTLANIQTLAWIWKHGARGVLLDREHDIRVLGEGRWEFPPHKGYLSVLALGDRAVVSETGVYYPLDHHPLECTFPLGVSNRVTADPAILTVHSGLTVCIVYYEEDNKNGQ